MVRIQRRPADTMGKNEKYTQIKIEWDGVSGGESGSSNNIMAIMRTTFGASRKAWIALWRAATAVGAKSCADEGMIYTPMVIEE